ncbi:MAG: AbrB/MazE/SpoVT family DNA-binding domain-containing protein [Thermoplasmataceae archaeon]
MSEEIEGREISARFRQGQFYIPKFYRDMFDIREGDYFILKVINRSHAKINHKPFQKGDNSRKGETSGHSNENIKGSSSSLVPDYKKPFNLTENEETPWDDE